MAADPRVRALAQVPLFAHATKKELEFIAAEMDEVDSPAGQVLTRQGKPGDTFYVVREGEAAVEVDGKPRRVLKAGDFFGEISMIDRGLATATVTTRAKTRLYVMSHAQFRDAIKSNDALMVKVLKAMGERLREDLKARA